MVARHVRIDRNGRPTREGRQLQLGELDHDAVARRHVPEPVDQRVADVAAEEHRVRRIRREQRRCQRGRRRLALRACDADRRRIDEAQDQGGLADERRRSRVAGGAARDECVEGGAQARLGRRVVGVDAGRGRHEVGAGPRRLRVDLGAEEEADRPAVEGSHAAGELGRRPAVVDRDVGVRIEEEAGQRDPRPREAEHRHVPSAQQAAPDGVHRESVGIDRRHRRRRAHCSAWMEARKRVTPSSPASAPTIQNRSVIFSSSQPPSSKWW
jgi:hypothetical protein